MIALEYRIKTRALSSTAQSFGRRTWSCLSAFIHLSIMYLSRYNLWLTTICLMCGGKPIFFVSVFVSEIVGILWRDFFAGMCGFWERYVIYMWEKWYFIVWVVVLWNKLKLCFIANVIYTVHEITLYLFTTGFLGLKLSLYSMKNNKKNILKVIRMCWTRTAYFKDFGFAYIIITTYSYIWHEKWF